MLLETTTTSVVAVLVYFLLRRLRRRDDEPQEGRLRRRRDHPHEVRLVTGPEAEALQAMFAAYEAAANAPGRQGPNLLSPCVEAVPGGVVDFLDARSLAAASRCDGTLHRATTKIWGRAYERDFGAPASVAKSTFRDDFIYFFF